MATQELFDIEQNLKHLAEQLATLNVEQNDILVRTETIHSEVDQLRARIDKKKKLVEQENNDKLLIEERLIATQRKNQKLKLKMISERQIHQEKIEIFKAPIIAALQTEVKPLATKAPQYTPTQSLTDRLPSTHKKVTQTTGESYYNNTSKGDYKPPLLFATIQHKPSDDSKPELDENQDDILARIRRNVQNE